MPRIRRIPWALFSPVKTGSTQHHIVQPPRSYLPSTAQMQYRDIIIVWIWAVCLSHSAFLNSSVAWILRPRNTRIRFMRRVTIFRLPHVAYKLCLKKSQFGQPNVLPVLRKTPFIKAIFPTSGEIGGPQTVPVYLGPQERTPRAIFSFSDFLMQSPAGDWRYTIIQSTLVF